MDERILKELKEWRQRTLARTLDILEQKPPIFVLWDRARNRYSYETDTGTRISLPTDAGVYVFYSAKTHRPVYVGQAGNLKKRLGQHCRVGGRSVFKRRWIRHWIDVQSAEEVVRFINSRMYLKYVILPFGRCEIETDLLDRWELHGPESVDPGEF